MDCLSIAIGTYSLQCQIMHTDRDALEYGMDACRAVVDG